MTSVISVFNQAARCDANEVATNATQPCTLQDVHDLPAVPHSTASIHVKHMPGNQMVWQLGKWLETETAKFNAQYAERQSSTPLLELLILATRQARQMHSKVFYELTKQVLMSAAHTVWACLEACSHQCELPPVVHEDKCRSYATAHLHVPICHMLCHAQVCADIPPDSRHMFHMVEMNHLKWFT